MRTIRAISAGVLLWILIFIEISIVMIGLKITGLTGEIIHFILLVPLTILCVWVYYKGKDKMNGFLLGIFMLLVGTILDLIITIPLFVKSYTGYYSSYYLWIGFAIVIVISGIYGLARKK